MRRPVEASLDDAIGDEPSLHTSKLGLVCRPVHGLAARREVLARDFGELALPERVVRTVLRLLDEVEALGDLAIGIPGVRAELGAPGERVGARILFVDGAVARARDVAGARVQHGRRAVVAGERACQCDEVLRAVRVRGDGVVERRVEVDHAGDVDHRVDRPREFAHERFVDAASRARHVAVDWHDLLAEEGVVAVAMRAPERPERLTPGDLAPEACVRSGPRFRPHDEVDAVDDRIAVEQHCPEDLAEKPGPAEDQDARAAQGARDVERGIGAGKGHAPPHTVTSAITIGGTWSIVISGSRLEPFAIASASTNVRAVSQPRSFGM